MPLIAIRITILRRQIAWIDITERERIAFVVVVRLICGQQVIDLELIPVCESFIKGKCHALVKRTRRTFGRTDLTNSRTIYPFKRRDAAWIQASVAAIYEPSKPSRFCVVVSDKERDVFRDLAFNARRILHCARIFEVACKDSDPWIVRRKAGRRHDSGVNRTAIQAATVSVRSRFIASTQEICKEDISRNGTVCISWTGNDQTRDASVVNARAKPDSRFAVASG